MFPEPDYRPLFKEFEDTGKNKDVFEKLISDVFKNYAITQSTLARFGPEKIVDALREQVSQEVQISVGGISSLIMREIVIRTRLYPFLKPSELEATVKLAEENPLTCFYKAISNKLKKEYYDTNPVILCETIDIDDPFNIRRLADYSRSYVMCEMTLEELIDRVRLKCDVYEEMTTPNTKNVLYNYLLPERFALHLYDLAKPRL
jgi:hypothetical protein